MRAASNQSVFRYLEPRRWRYWKDCATYMIHVQSYLVPFDTHIHAILLCHTPSFTFHFVTHNCFNFSILHRLLSLSFPVPATTFDAHYWKKLTCGVIRSFNFWNPMPILISTKRCALQVPPIDLWAAVALNLFHLFPGSESYNFALAHGDHGMKASTHGQNSNGTWPTSSPYRKSRLARNTWGCLEIGYP